MFLENGRIRIDEFSNKKTLPSVPLQYMGPHMPRWGIIDTALLMPDSVGLLVGPAGCLRQSFFDVRKHGSVGRLYLLPVSETDLVTGEHLQKVKGAIIEIAVKKKPGAIILCIMCVDDILGSDYEGIAEEMEAILDISISIVKRIPICRDKKPSPEQRGHAFFYNFLESARKKDASKKDTAVNILGAYKTISKESEIYELLLGAGFSKIYQIADCVSFDHFADMAMASHNLVIHPCGILLAKEMEKHMGIPYCFVPASFGFSAVEENYKKIETFLNAELNTTPYREKAEHYLAVKLNRLSGKKIAVGSGINGSPFETARALIEFGLEINAIFVDKVKDCEWSHIDWLAGKCPQLFVYRIFHPCLMEHLEEWADIDLALGPDAGYYCTCAKTVSIPLDVQGYGYQNSFYLIREIFMAMEDISNQREFICSSSPIV